MCVCTWRRGAGELVARCTLHWIQYPNREGGERVVACRGRVSVGAPPQGESRERAYDQGLIRYRSEPSPLWSFGFHRHVHHLPDVDREMVADITLFLRQEPISSGECIQGVFLGSYLFGARQDGR